MTSPVSEHLDAPERIWATVNGASTRLPDGGRQLLGGWSQDPERPRAMEYVRADIHAALARKAEANEQLAIANGQRAREEHFRTEDAERKAEALRRENAEKDARIAALEKGLTPFARIADLEPRVGAGGSVMVNVNRCRDARALLGGSDAE